MAPRMAVGREAGSSEEEEEEGALGQRPRAGRGAWARAARAAMARPQSGPQTEAMTRTPSPPPLWAGPWGQRRGESPAALPFQGAALAALAGPSGGEAGEAGEAEGEAEEAEPPASGSRTARAAGSGAAWRRMRTPSPVSRYEHSRFHGPKAPPPAMRFLFPAVYVPPPMLWLPQGPSRARATSASREVSATGAATAVSPSASSVREGDAGAEAAGDAESAGRAGLRKSTRRGRRGRRGRPRRLSQNGSEEHQAADRGSEEETGRGRQRGAAAAVPGRKAAAITPSAGAEAREAEMEDGLAAEARLAPEPTRVPPEHPEAAAAAAAAGAAPSRGSLGHPQSCGLACKYARKSRGCKDGYACARCHLCRWSSGS